MKKCAVISLYGNENYGNKLQNYAVCEILKKYKITPEVIRYIHYENDINYRRNYMKIFNPDYVYSKLKKCCDKLIYKNKQINRFNSFLEFNKLINYSKYIIDNKEKVKKIKDNYDYFLFGSDQIWNIGSFRFYDLAFGTYFDREKKFSLSASFGINKIPEIYKEKYINGINDIKYISVREDAGKRIIEDLTNRKDSIVLVDPTMILKKEDWLNVSKKPRNMPKGKYILNYFLGELSKEEKNNIIKFANEHDMQIINILDKKDPYYECGPSEFIYLENNANLICTDSFHSCVFGILMETPFIIFNRKDENKSIYSRLETLLTKFNLQDRKYNGVINEKMLNCNYQETSHILKKEREKMFNYLNKIFIDGNDE